jgi:predicted regulator of Ras-like GTPase activity (Roadblock/LC7/MglB family)
MFRELFRILAGVIPGFRAASVVGYDGIEIESHVPSDLPHEVLSAELNGILRNLDRLKADVGMGTLEEVVIRTNAENILLLRLSPELFILVITEPGHSTGQARYEVQRLAHRFLEALL